MAVTVVSGMNILKNYLHIDYLTQGYSALIGLLVLFFHGDRVPYWYLVLGCHVIVLVAIHGLIHWHAKNPDSRAVRFLRFFYPLILYTGFYRETGILNQLFIDGCLDPVFIQLEETIFGFQPSLQFSQLLSYRWFAEVMYGAYFSYYLMITGVGVALYLRQGNHFSHYLCVVSFVFYVCYFIYICLPVIGPRLFYQAFAGYSLPAAFIPAQVPPVPESIQKAVFYRLMYVIYKFEAPGAAFPSSHVAVALCTLYFSFRYLRRIRWVHAACVLLLCLSTVYGRYHYALDVIAGGMTAALLIPLGNRIYAKLGGQSNPSERSTG